MSFSLELLSDFVKWLLLSDVELKNKSFTVYKWMINSLVMCSTVKLFNQYNGDCCSYWIHFLFTKTDWSEHSVKWGNKFLFQFLTWLDGRIGDAEVVMWPMDAPWLQPVREYVVICWFWCTINPMLEPVIGAIVEGVVKLWRDCLIFSFPEIMFLLGRIVWKGDVFWGILDCVLCSTTFWLAPMWFPDFSGGFRVWSFTDSKQILVKFPVW